MGIMGIIPGLVGWLPRVCSKLAKRERGRSVFVIAVILVGLGSDQILISGFRSNILTKYPKGSGGP